MRIDNSDPEVIEYYELEFDETDPAATAVVDLCKFCATWGAELEIDHPHYEDGDVCFECGESLVPLK